MLEVNDIICVAPDASTVIEGIVRYVGGDSKHNAYMIRLDNNPLTAPYKVTMHELRSAILAGDILLDQQVELDMAKTTDLLSPVAVKQMEKAVEILAPLLEDDNILFDSELRGRLFNERAKYCKVHPRLVRRLYYQYLWGGKTELAVAPHYANRGGSGKKQKTGSKRRGPKAKDECTASLVSLPEVREDLVKGAKLFFLPGNRTLEEAFMDTKKKYFSNGARIERGGKVHEILLSPEKLPSLGQFRYVCDELRQGQPIKKIARRIRQKSEGWDFRGWSRDGVLGPGFRFEIDSTKIQIKLVSRYNRAKVLKNATLYVVVDIWSGAIVGYALSLQNSSWALAARALHNCFTDKQEVFDRLGLDYSSEDWCCHHLPIHLAADRGELVSDKAGLVPELGIVVEIMPPMCPERKGKIESTIKNIKHGHSHRLPGRHAKYLQRREHDGIDSAALTIDELEKIIVEIIMGLNHDPAPISHIPPEMMEEGETDVTHIGLYRWGLKHYFGHTRKLTSAVHTKEKNRTRLLEYLATHPGASRSDIMKNLPGVYDSLITLDKDWFYTQITLKKVVAIAPRKDRVDWANLDKLMQSEITTLFDKMLASELRPVQATANAALNQAHLKAKYNNNPSKFPLVTEVLQKRSETHSEFVLRRISWAVKQMMADNVPISVNKLRRVAGFQAQIVRDHKRQVRDLAQRLKVGINNKSFFA